MCLQGLDLKCEIPRGLLALVGVLLKAVSDDAFEAEPLSQAVMGPAMFQSWLEYKREEWRAYSVYVTDWEKERYLKFF